MVFKMNNINDKSFQKNINEYLSTAEGEEKITKVLPLLVAGFAHNTEENITSLSRQSLVHADSIEKIVKAVSQLAQNYESQRKAIAEIMAVLRLQPKQESSTQATGQIQPTQPMVRQGNILEELSSMLDNKQYENQQA